MFSINKNTTNLTNLANNLDLSLSFILKLCSNKGLVLDYFRSGIILYMKETCDAIKCVTFGCLVQMLA
jgi:hypothetical protein